MDPITIGLLAVLLLGAGGGFLWYEKWGPGASSSAPPRQITLDADLPDADKQAVIAAIMSSTSAAPLMQLAAKYGKYPWTTYELNYRAWELNGSQGSPPPSPSTAAPSAVIDTPAPPPSPSSQSGQPPAPTTAASVATAAQQSPSVPPPVAPAPPPVPAAVQKAAQAVAIAIASDPHYCTNVGIAGTPVNSAVHNFKLVWNVAFPSNVVPIGTGKYEQPTADAVAKALGGAVPAPAACGGTATAGLGEGVQGQGSYAAYPSEGGGPGDTRYGAKGANLTRVSGLGEGVQGLGEGVQGLGEGVQGLGEVVQGLGEDEVQGLGEDVQGNPVRQRQAVTKKKDMAGAAASAATAALAAAAAMPTSRPKGGWFVHMRPSDNIWPRKITEIGSGVARGTQGSLKHLADINPHLAPGGVMRQLRAGDEINIPDTWATPLRQRGLDVRSDAHIEGVMGLGEDVG